MHPRPRGTRDTLIGALAAVALGVGLLSAPTSASSTPNAQQFFPPRLVTVDTPARADKERLQTLGLDLTEHAGHDYVEVVLHTPADLVRLVEGGFTYDVRIPDLIARGIEIADANEAYAASVAKSPLPSGRDTYRTLADYNADMEALAEDHKKIVKRFKLNQPSVEGRDIWGIEIGKGVRKGLKEQPTFVLMGLHHAREWPSGELAMEFAFDLVKNYGKNARITRLLKKARVIVVPVINVDGFDLSRTDGEYVDLRELREYDPLEGTGTDLATPGQAYKRKNCRVVDGQSIPTGSCRLTLASPGGFGLGVDLNRNYGGFWGGPGAAGTLPDPNADRVGGLADPTYRGPSAFSEPETQNVQDLIGSRQVTMMISNHTYSNLILRPNGVNPNTIGPDGKPVGDAPDEEALKKVGAKMAAQNGYANIHGWQLYDTTGTTEDWSYNNTGGFGYTFEIGPNEFHPPFPEVVDEYLGAGKYKGKGNREAYLIALEHAVNPAYSGLIKGKAPKGATLRLRKSFNTPTWEGSFKDGVNTPIKVGGRFSWLVNPSTRPVVRPRKYQELADEPYATRVTEGTTAGFTEHTDHTVVLKKAVANWRVELNWPTPDDLDLEIYRKEGGKLVEVGGSGNAPGAKELADVPNAPKGTYVLRVINYASISPTYTLTESFFNAVRRTSPGKREVYTFTCEKGGKVLQKGKVFIDRGQTVRLNLAECRRKA